MESGESVSLERRKKKVADINAITDDSPTPQDDQWNRHGHQSGAVDGITYQRQMQQLEAEKAQVASMGGSMVTPENRSAIRQLIDAISSEKIPPSPNSAARAVQGENPAGRMENSLARGGPIYQGNISALSQGMSMPPQPQITHTASVSGGWGYPNMSLPGSHPPGAYYGLQGANQWGGGMGYHGYDAGYGGAGMGGIYGGPIPGYPVHYPVHGHGQYFDPRGYPYAPQQHAGQPESLFYGDAGGYAAYQGAFYGENSHTARNISGHYPQAPGWETAPAAPPLLRHASSQASLVAAESYTNEITPSEEGKVSLPNRHHSEACEAENTAEAKPENNVSGLEPHGSLRENPTDIVVPLETEQGQYSEIIPDNANGESEADGESLWESGTPVVSGDIGTGAENEERRGEEEGGKDEREGLHESVHEPGSVRALGYTEMNTEGEIREDGADSPVISEDEQQRNEVNVDESILGNGREGGGLPVQETRPEPTPTHPGAVTEIETGTLPLVPNEPPPNSAAAEMEPVASPKPNEPPPLNETSGLQSNVTSYPQQPIAEEIFEVKNQSNSSVDSQKWDPPATSAPSAQQKAKESVAPPPERIPVSANPDGSPVKSNSKPPISGGGSTDSISHRSSPVWMSSPSLIGFTGLTTIATVQPANRQSIPRLGASQSQPVIPVAERSNSAHSMQLHPTRDPHTHRMNEYHASEIPTNAARNLFSNPHTSHPHSPFSSIENPHEMPKFPMVVTKSPSAPTSTNSQNPTPILLANGQREIFASPRMGSLGSGGREMPVLVEMSSAAGTPAATPIPSDSQPHLLPQRIQSLPVDMSRGAPVFHRMGPPLMIPHTSPHMQSRQNPPSGGSLGGRLPSNPNLGPNEEMGRLMEEVAALRGTVHALLVENGQLTGKSEKLGEINRELKRLMVASLGDDLARDIADLTQAKVELSREVADMKMERDDINEMMSQGQIDADVWRTKYHAAEVMVRELSARATQATERVQELEAERARASAAVTECHGLLHAVVKHMRKRDGRASIWEDEEYESVIQQVPPPLKGSQPPPDHHAQISESAARLACLVASALVMSMASLSPGVLSPTNTQPSPNSPVDSRAETPKFLAPPSRPSSMAAAPAGETHTPTTTPVRNSVVEDKKRSGHGGSGTTKMTPQATPENPPKAKISQPKGYVAHENSPSASALYPPGPVARSDSVRVQASHVLRAAPPPENLAKQIGTRSNTAANQHALTSQPFSSSGANQNMQPPMQPPSPGVANRSMRVDVTPAEQGAPLPLAASETLPPKLQSHSDGDPMRSAERDTGKATGVKGTNLDAGTSFGTGGQERTNKEELSSSGVDTSGKGKGMDREGGRKQKRNLDISAGCSKCKGKVVQV